jgi:hypothetical protein
MSIYDDVKQSLNIREVIEFYGVKVGRNGSFCCPFHNEKHPSASIKNDYFNCFACGVGGDLITFTAKLHGIGNYDACKKLAEDFGLNIAQPQTQADRLRADRERAKRQAEQKREAEIEAVIQHTGKILAQYHCYLWQGRRYPFGSVQHTRSLHWLDYAQYLNDCYEENPREFSLENREQVAKIENRLLEWHHEEQ